MPLPMTRKSVSINGALYRGSRPVRTNGPWLPASYCMPWSFGFVSRAPPGPRKITTQNRYGFPFGLDRLNPSAVGALTPVSNRLGPEGVIKFDLVSRFVLV